MKEIIKPQLLIETEFSNIEILNEKNKDGNKLYVEGVFTVMDKVNGNKRRYSENVFMPAVDKFNSNFIDKRNSIGELNHPNDRVRTDVGMGAIMIESLYKVNNKVMGKARVMEEMPRGKILAALIRENWQPCISSRGVGSGTQKNGIMEVGNNFQLFSYDIVDIPSEETAIMNPVYESLVSNWVYDKKSGLWLEGGIQREENSITEDDLLNKISDYVKTL